jgi:hypothetical protein
MRRPHSTIYDTSSGRLLVQSPDIAPLGLSLTRGEIALLLASSQPSDITTPYGRLRTSTAQSPDRADERTCCRWACRCEHWTLAPAGSRRRMVALWLRPGPADSRA